MGQHGKLGARKRRLKQPQIIARDAINALAKNVQLGVTKEGKILCVLGDEFANIRFTVEQKNYTPSGRANYETCRGRES